MMCCKSPNPVRNPDDCIAVLKEPLTAVRFFGTRCKNCKTLQVSPEDLARNQKAALRVAKQVRVAPAVYRDLYR